MMIEFNGFNKYVTGLIGAHKQDFVNRPENSMKSLARIGFIKGYDLKQEENDKQTNFLVERLKSRVLEEIKFANSDFTYKEALVMMHLMIEDVFNK